MTLTRMPHAKTIHCLQQYMVALLSGRLLTPELGRLDVTTVLYYTSCDSVLGSY